MRFQLRDLLIAVFLIAISANTATVLLSPIDLPSIIAWIVPVVAGIACYLILSSLIYRGFRLFPLLLPKCPNCRNANRHYFSLDRRWPTEMVECANYHSSIELYVTPTVYEPGTRGGLRFQLLWPYSFGGSWRRV